MTWHSLATELRLGDLSPCHQPFRISGRMLSCKN